VTYGRTVVFTATSTEVESASDIEEALKVSYDASLANVEVDQTLRDKASSVLNKLEIKVLALGGNSGDVAGAIQTGQWDMLFAHPDILSAVPLRYVVRNLNGTRPIARLGDTTSFTVAECSPTMDAPKPTGWLLVDSPPGVELTDFSSDHEEAWAVGHVGTQYGVYRVEGGALVSKGAVDIHNLAVDSEGTVWGLTHDGTLYNTSASASSWSQVLGQGGQILNYRSIDAGGGGPGVIAMSNTYGNDGSRDFYYLHNDNGGLASVYIMDDAQYVPDDTYSAINGAALYIDSGDDAWVRKCSTSTGCGRRQGTLLVQAPDHIKQLSAVTETLALIVDGSGKVEELDGTKFTVLDVQPSTTPLHIEADPGRRHWMIGADNRVYRYAPPAPTPAP
jgi:hypothetical protein